jgi:hypothetical protein
MPPHTLHVVQAFEQREGGIVPVEPKACPSAASARALAAWAVTFFLEGGAMNFI